MSVIEREVTTAVPRRAGSGGVFRARVRAREAQRSGAIAEAQFIGIHYLLRRDAPRTKRVSAERSWACVCGATVPVDYIRADGTDSGGESPRLPGLSASEEEAFYAFPGHAECTARSQQRPGVEAQVFLACRRAGSDVVAHLWCAACGDVGATAAQAPSERDLVLRFDSADARSLSSSSARELVTRHEDTCVLLRRYILAVHPERETWTSPEVRFTEFIASLDGTTLRDELTFGIRVGREGRN